MILCINTTTSQFGICLLKNDGTVSAEFFQREAKGRFGGLFPAIHFLLAASRSHAHDLECVIATTGPGSFTGLRIGLAAAKGLCHALSIPIIGVSSLEAMASQILFSEWPITPVIYSRKGELFAAQFLRRPDQGLIRILDDVSLKPENLPSFNEKPSLFIGNDFKSQAPIIRNALGSKALFVPAEAWNLKASAVGCLGLQRFRDQDFDDPHELNPSYLRPPDIRPNPYSSKGARNPMPG